MVAPDRAESAGVRGHLSSTWYPRSHPLQHERLRRIAGIKQDIAHQCFACTNRKRLRYAIEEMLMSAGCCGLGVGLRAAGFLASVPDPGAAQRGASRNLILDPYSIRRK